MAEPIQAAVVRAAGGPFLLETVTLEDPRPDEVLVRIVAAGMCHTDLITRDQYFGTPLPMILGHEGAGVVERVGSAVRKVEPGDHVVLTFASCGRCRLCLKAEAAYCEKGAFLNYAGCREDGSIATAGGQGMVHSHFFGQSSFAAYSLAQERGVVKVPRNAPLELLGPLGCGIQTGAGAVMNSLGVRAGASFAAFGSGAVGLSAIMAARVVGATTVVAVDVQPGRLALARELGATHAIDARERNAVEAVREITGGGVDFSLESTGRPEVLRQAVDALGVRGACGVVGAPRLGTEFSLDVIGFMAPGKTLRGIMEGDSVPDLFIPQLVDLFMQGRFPIDRLARFYDFADINRAAQESEAGTAIKPILRLSQARA